MSFSKRSVTRLFTSQKLIHQCELQRHLIIAGGFTCHLSVCRRVERCVLYGHFKATMPPPHTHRRPTQHLSVILMSCHLPLGSILTVNASSDAYLFNFCRRINFCPMFPQLCLSVSSPCCHGNPASSFATDTDH